MENKKDRETDAGKPRRVIPAEFVAEISHGENRKGSTHEEKGSHSKDFDASLFYAIRSEGERRKAEIYFEGNFRVWQLAIPHTNAAFSREKICLFCRVESSSERRN